MKNLADNSFLEFVDIDDISPSNMENVIDITVEEDSSFVLANGMISHNSAISGLVEARDSTIHGGLPLRGKVLNVNGVPLKKIYENEALAQITNSLGLIIGQRANRHMLRYGKCYIATDADEDGKNITSLLVNFFYTLWPELFNPDNPFLYVFETPLIIAKKGKTRKYWFADDVFDGDTVKGWEVVRCKGLAALTKEDWRNMLEKPKLTPIVDDGALEEALSLLFNDKRADDRKAFMGI